MANRANLDKAEKERPGGYEKSKGVTDAEKAVKDQQDRRPDEYTSRWDSQIQDALGRVKDRPGFRYDFNSDPLYQMYRQQYTQLGQQAAANAAAESAALTGGFGNSYAASAAAQANQNYLDRLNGIIPDLYDRAAARYDAEGDELWRMLTAYQDLDETDYDRYRDRYGDWEWYLDYLTGRADTEYDRDYQQYSDRYSQWQDWLNYWSNEYAGQVDQDRWAAEMDERRRQFDEQMAFDREQFTYRQAQDALAAQQAAARSSGGTGSKKSSGTQKSSSKNNGKAAESKSESKLDHNIYNELRALSGQSSLGEKEFNSMVQYRLAQGTISQTQADSLLAEHRRNAAGR